jgi:hypothetical protein
MGRIRRATGLKLTVTVEASPESDFRQIDFGQADGH